MCARVCVYSYAHVSCNDSFILYVKFFLLYSECADLSDISLVKYPDLYIPIDYTEFHTYYQCMHQTHTFRILMVNKYITDNFL